MHYYVCSQVAMLFMVFYIHVSLPIVNLPTIKLQPVSQTITLRVNNYNLSLSCGADGNNLEYTWEKSDSVIPNNTNGSDTTTLYFFNISPENAGKYRCKATNGTGFGYSDYAVLKIQS